MLLYSIMTTLAATVESMLVSHPYVEPDPCLMIHSPSPVLTPLMLAVRMPRDEGNLDSAIVARC